jgi:hypothetical protein
MIRKSNRDKAKGVLGPFLLILFAIWLAFHFMGCRQLSPEEISSDRDTEARKAMGQITYHKDPDTGLCFAVIAEDLNTEYPYTGLANVPCEKVENFFYRVEEEPPGAESDND